MKTESQKLSIIINNCELTLDGIKKYPLMYGGSMHATELLVTYYLSFRAFALDLEQPNIRKWYFMNYPDIPGSVRDITKAIETNYPKNEQQNKFKEELSKMIDHFRDDSK